MNKTILSILAIACMALFATGMILYPAQNNAAPPTTEVASASLPSSIIADEGLFERASSLLTGADHSTPFIRWETPILVQATGTPSDDDLFVLQQQIVLLSSIKGLPPIKFVQQNGTMVFHFAPQQQLPAVDPLLSTEETHWGAFRLYYRADSSEIVYASSVIASDGLSQMQRSHAIVQNMAKMLGVTHTTDESDSIFYASFSNIQQLSQKDRDVIALLYSGVVRTGWSYAHLKEAVYPSNENL
ncbi:DUF2927 domain-containing protein [Clostridia bacterium OttesenSCG-928-F22]|nr:DUF2927 domain-containing protein [Clostridia bacterium OttesenSCG-928-F22]